MAKIELKFVSLHAPLFHAGKNFGLKLEPDKVSGLRVFYDEEKSIISIQWNDQVSIMPLSNIVSMTPGEAKKKAPVAVVAQPKMTAQVSTPMSHVFAGEGHGDTGLAKPTGKVIL